MHLNLLLSQQRTVFTRRVEILGAIPRAEGSLLGLAIKISKSGGTSCSCSPSSEFRIGTTKICVTGTRISTSLYRRNAADSGDRFSFLLRPEWQSDMPAGHLHNSCRRGRWWAIRQEYSVRFGSDFLVFFVFSHRKKVNLVSNNSHSPTRPTLCLYVTAAHPFLSATIVDIET